MADKRIHPPGVAEWTAIVDRYSDQTVEGLVHFDAWLAEFPHEARVAELDGMERLWSSGDVEAYYPQDAEEYLRLAAIWRLRHQFL
jgi:hypothetical protein